MGTFRLKVPSNHPPAALHEIQPDGAEHPLSEGSVFGLTGEALANRVRATSLGNGFTGHSGLLPGCRYSMRDKSLRPNRHHPVRHLSAAATRLPQLPPRPTHDPVLALKPSVTTFYLPGTIPNQEDAYTAAIDDPEEAGLRVIA